MQPVLVIPVKIPYHLFIQFKPLIDSGNAGVDRLASRPLQRDARKATIGAIFRGKYGRS